MKTSGMYLMLSSTVNTGIRTYAKKDSVTVHHVSEEYVFNQDELDKQGLKMTANRKERTMILGDLTVHGERTAWGFVHTKQNERKKETSCHATK